jgi:hypothetical protein
MKHPVPESFWKAILGGSRLEGWVAIAVRSGGPHLPSPVAWLALVELTTLFLCTHVILLAPVLEGSRHTPCAVTLARLTAHRSVPATLADSTQECACYYKRNRASVPNAASSIAQYAAGKFNSVRTASMTVVSYQVDGHRNPPSYRRFVSYNA